MATTQTGSGSPLHEISADLLDSLCNVLPKGYRFRAYHLSTPPTRTDALFAPPPDVRPDRTYCEHQFLALSIIIPSSGSSEERSINGHQEASPEKASSEREVLVLALEILIYTTAYSSTFFVSKADSTGYLHLLNLPKGTPSPIREVTATFIAYLVRHRRREGIQSTVSLFARAQGQYLFPGSVEYKGKHVLTDRGLVKWWCRVLTPLLDRKADGMDPWRDVKGYLLVPGLDHYETRAFIPRTGPNNSPDPNWVLGHPLEKISHYTREHDWVPPRCLIAHYPDDPKSRFRDELDLEADNGKGRNGNWKSVHSLDQFWEMMAFRQECSMGALTGFIWLVMDPQEPKEHPVRSSQSSLQDLAPLQTPVDSEAAPSTSSRVSNKQMTAHGTSQNTLKELDGASPSPEAGSLPNRSFKKNKQQKKKLTGPIVSREPRIKTAPRNYLHNLPTDTAYYHWPSEGRGRRLVRENDYKSSIELLLRLDFANLELATGSTRRWVNEVGLGAPWALELIGSRPPPPTPEPTSDPATVNASGLVKRKQPPTETPADSAGNVNVLGAGLVKKKQKAAEPPPSSPAVNVLSAGLIRKKPKAV